jgi:hypothetical protein
MTVREGHPGLLPLASPLRREFVPMGGGQYLCQFWSTSSRRMARKLESSPRWK